MVTLNKVVPERLEAATQPRAQFRGTGIKGRRCSDHMRRQEKQNTQENWDHPSVLPGRDGITRAVKLVAGKSYLELAVQYLHSLELRCDQKTTKETNENHST